MLQTVSRFSLWPTWWTSVNSGSEKKESSWENNFEYTAELLEMAQKKIDEMWSKWLAMDEWKANNMKGINFFSFTSISAFFHLSNKFSLASLLWLLAMPFPSQSIYLKLFACLLNTIFSLAIYVVNELQTTLNYKTFFCIFLISAVNYTRTQWSKRKSFITGPELVMRNFSRKKYSIKFLSILQEF